MKGLRSPEEPQVESTIFRREGIPFIHPISRTETPASDEPFTRVRGPTVKIRVYSLSLGAAKAPLSRSGAAELAHV